MAKDRGLSDVQPVSGWRRAGAALGAFALLAATGLAGAAVQSLTPPPHGGAAGIRAELTAARQQHVSGVAVSKPVVSVTSHGTGWQYVTATFPACVDRVEAYAEPVSGDYADFSWTHYPAVHEGQAVTVRIPFSRSDETGGWVVTGVIGFLCGTARVITLDSTAFFQVRG